MWGRRYRQRLRSSLKQGLRGERGAVATEYTVMMAGLVVMVIAGLLFLGGSVGGGLGGVSWTEAVVTSPLEEADYAIEPHECKKGGWQSLYREGYDPDDPAGWFNNQGDCMQYANTGK